MFTKVHLRQKKISKGRASLYLDFWPPIISPKTGKPTRRHFLNIYILLKPKNQQEKAHNSNILIIAESAKREFENKLNKPEIYSDLEKEQLRIRETGERSFSFFFKEIIKSRKESTRHGWESVYYYFSEFANGEDIKFNQVDEKFCENFKSYLVSAKSKKSEKINLSQNTAGSYFNKFKEVLKLAYRDKLLSIDINSFVSGIANIETIREFLTIKELNTLVNTPCDIPVLKRASLFSALSSLAFDDCKRLRKKDIRYSEDLGYHIPHSRGKTKKVNILPISDQAVEVADIVHLQDDDLVFDGLEYHSSTRALKRWIKKAGISKKITFHNFRHTYATLQLAKGTDIYTVSKMLGHKDLKTTQIYAKVVDSMKREAADKIILNIKDVD